MPSLSQTYRPKRFADVTGQSWVTETLRQEVASGILGHAYLFSGPRGVGKTTAARIFAKALNCEHPEQGEPCNVCTLCTATNEGKCVDLIELDAATHTGIDTVREAIIEHARFAPMQGKRKVYILDEAHMLSASSWNALLKTLEEPPSYAFFILATTEWHKVPATIVSRCQRFEFRRVNDQDLMVRLQDLAKKEGWTLDSEVTKLIVSRADGCVRDAETLLGQLGSLGVSTIDLETARLVIPEGHLPLASGLMMKWADRDHAGSLAEARRLFDEGIPVLPLFDDLIEIVRWLLVASGDPSFQKTWATGDEDHRAMAPLVGRFEPAELHDMALLLMERRRDLKGGADPLFVLQLAGTAIACGLLRFGSKETTQVDKKSDSDGSAPPVFPSLRAERSNLPSEIPASSPTPPRNDAGEDGQDIALIDLSFARAKWNAIVRAVEERNHSLPFILKLSRPEEARGDTLVIRFQYAFHRDKIISDVKNCRIVEECVRTVLGYPTLKLEGIIGEDTEAKEHRSADMVSNILQAFGGSVVES